MKTVYFVKSESGATQRANQITPVSFLTIVLMEPKFVPDQLNGFRVEPELSTVQFSATADELGKIISQLAAARENLLGLVQKAPETTQENADS